MIELKVIKKWQPPISTSTPHFQVYPTFLAKNVEPPLLVTQFLESPTPPSPFNKGGVPTMSTPPPRKEWVGAHYVIACLYGLGKEGKTKIKIL